MGQDHKANQLERGDNPMRVFNNDKVEVYDQTNFSIEDIPDSAIESTQSGQPARGLSARHIQMISLGGCIGWINGIYWRLDRVKIPNYSI
ncbi:unnamed protein product [Rhizopus stolonifer]